MTDPRFRLTESFMAQVYAAQTGAELAEAAKAVSYFLAISQAMALITAASLEQNESDAKAFDLRAKKIDGKPITATIIALRLGRSRAAVFNAIKRHQERRRAALKMTA